jgi:type I restriction enzyme M protein
MTNNQQKELGKILWAIADQLRGAMNADDFRDYMLSFLFLRYLSDNYEAAARKELGRDYPSIKEQPDITPLALWYAANPQDTPRFEQQMRRKVHYIIKPQHLWGSIAQMARVQNGDLLKTLQEGFKFIETSAFAFSVSISNRHMPFFLFSSLEATNNRRLGFFRERSYQV